MGVLLDREAMCLIRLPLPSPPTFPIAAFGRRSGASLLIPDLLDQQLAARGRQCHDEFVVTLKALGGVFRHRLNQSIAGGLRDSRHDQDWRRHWRVHVRGQDILDGRSLKRDVPR